MLIISENKLMTASEVRAGATDGDGFYFIHRGKGEHHVGPECWCMPLVMTGEQIWARSLPDLQRTLAEHFSVN